MIYRVLSLFQPLRLGAICALGALFSLLLAAHDSAQPTSAQPTFLTKNTARPTKTSDQPTKTATHFAVVAGQALSGSMRSGAQAGHLARQAAQDRAMLAGLRGQLRREVLPPSPFLGGRRVVVWIYLPPGYDASTARYPVAYLLHGAPGEARDWWINARAQRVAESLLLSGKVAPMLLVAFDAFGPRGLDDAQNYLDRADGSFQMESFFTRTLVPAIDARFRTRADAGSRALVGFSAGGYGAANLGFKHPEIWRVIASVAGFFDPGDDANNSTKILGPKSPLWDANSPLLRARALPTGTRLHFFLSCGRADPLFPEFRRMERELRARGADYRARQVSGDHDWDTLHRQLFDVLQFCDRRWKELSDSGAPSSGGSSPGEAPKSAERKVTGGAL